MGISQRFLSLAVGLVLGLCLVASASAKDFYTVKLTNGTSFESLRQPRVAAWDEEMILVLTDTGNWVGFLKADVDSVTASVEASGLGTIIDANTILVGILGDFDDESDEDEGEVDEETLLRRQLLGAIEGLSGAGAEGESGGRGGAETPNITTEQFVNPEDTVNSGGIPLSYVTGNDNN
jgi:hypothetical protein